MERRFHTARQLQETLDYAGPDRNLGLLYWRAPGWPASVGSRPQAARISNVPPNSPPIIP